MKKVLINLVILVATAINITGIMGQTAKNDPNAIGIYQMTPTQSMGQLDGSIKWEGNVTRDLALNEAVETLNRYNDQLDWGFAPIDKDYYVSSVLPKLKTGNLEPGVDDPLISGKSGTNKVSTNNNPGFTKDDLFWYWDVRSYNHPSETYRVYLHKVICNNGVEYFQKLEEAPLVNTVIKTDTVVDTFTVFKEKLVEVPVVGTTTAAMPDIINNNYNTNNVYPSGSSGGYDSDGNYWTEQPSYGSYGQSCYPGCFLCSFLGYFCPLHCGNSHGGYPSGGCNYQQSCQQAAPGGTTIIINEGDVIVEVVVEGDDDEEEGDDNDPDGPDTPDDDGPKGPNIPDDDEINGRNGSSTATTEGVKPPMGSDPREIVSDSQNSETKALNGKPEMGSAQNIVNDVKGNVMVGADETMAVVQNPKGNVQDGGNSVAVVSKPDTKSNPKGVDGSSKPVVVDPAVSVSKGNTVKSNTGEAVVVAPNPSASKGNVIKNNTGEAVAVVPNVKTDPKGEVANNGDAQTVAVDPVVSKGGVVKNNTNDAVAVVPVVSTKGKVVKDNKSESQDNNQNTVRTENKKSVSSNEGTTDTGGEKSKYDTPKYQTPKDTGSGAVTQQKKQGVKNQTVSQPKAKVQKKKAGG